MSKLKEQQLPENASQVPSFWRIVKREFSKDKVAIISLMILTVIILTVFIGAFLYPDEKVLRVSIIDKYSPPGEKYLLGADIGGRPITGLLLIGARNSILICLVITLLTEFIGISIGLIAGFYGGWVDNIIMRVCDFIQVLPITMIVIAYMVTKQTSTIWDFIFVMTVFLWVGITRLVRSKALSENRKDYVNASRTMGTSDLKIMFGGILPNISSIIIVDSILGFAGNLGIETGLSFLGFGLPPSTPSLGTLIAYARKPEVISGKPWVWVPASLLLLVMMLSINYVGQAIKRAADAKQRLG
ncbi:MAG: ABC transporter permease [Tissierellia bacterium]|nr:ABC transporter permease [Tissierellia bacterium]